MESSNNSCNNQEEKRRVELLRELVLGEEEVAIDVEAALDLPLPERLQLFKAARCGDEESLKKFPSEEDPALAVTTEGSSALHVVATGGDGAGHLKSAKVIHGKAWQLLLACNNHGDTPLHCTARAGNTKMVLRLIELAADDMAARDMMRMQNKDGKTALHDAIASRDVPMVKQLINKDNKLALVD